MANKNMRQELENQRRNLQKLDMDYRNSCHHDKPGCLVPLREYEGFVPNRASYGDGDGWFFCLECKEVIPLISFTRDELVSYIRSLKGAANQTKIFSNLTDDELDTLYNIQTILDNLEVTFVPFYDKIINRFSNNKSKGNKNNRPRKGSLSSAITSSNFNRR